MKKQLSLLTLMLVPLFVAAAPVTREAAQQRAAEFLSAKHPQHARRSLRAAQSTPALKPVSAQQYYYVFNVGDNNGYVIVSGDDRTESILGYSDSGSFNEQNMPENMQAWLQGYSDQLRWLDEHPQFDNVAPARKAPRKVDVKYAIPPLMNSLWNQRAPYNNSCPDFFSYGKSVTGCAATAMAQVMYYHKWPAATTKEIPAYSYNTNYGQMNISAIPANTTFDWNNMLPSYSGSESSAQNAAVAGLLVACGTSINMKYTSSSSSAALSNVAGALKEYFDYSATTTYIFRDDFLLDEWTELIYAELQASRPVLYSGQSSGGGHGFVLDGFDGEGYFHVNWGWGGDSNGYFLISVLNPGSSSGTGASSSRDGYSLSQEAVIGIKKNEGESALGSAPMTGDLVEVSGNKIYFSAYNKSGATNTFQIGLAFVEDDGTIIYNIAEFNAGELNNNTGYSRIGATVSSLSEGTYKIVPICRISGTDTWYPYVNVRKKYVLAEASGGTVTLTLVVAQSALQVTSFTLPNNPLAGDNLAIIANVKNTGDEFYNNLYLFASTTGVKGDAIAQTGCTVRKGETFPVEFFCALTETGTNTLWVATDAAGNNVIGQTTMNVSGTSGAGVTDNIDLSYSAPVITPLTSDGSKILGTHVTVSIQVTNNSNYIYQGNAGVVCYEWSGGTATGNGTARSISIAPHGTKTLTATFDLNTSKTYAFDLSYQKNGAMYSSQTYARNDKSVVLAINLYFADGSRQYIESSNSIAIPSNTTAVDLRGNTQVTNIIGGNPNTLYFLDASGSTPTGVGQNVIRNGAIENLAITDGYDFATPFAFTASDVTYTRTFTTGYDRDGNGWSTITLPFDVNNTMVVWNGAAYPIDWFRGSDDTGKNFWIMQFAHEDNGVVYFTHAKSFKAGIPYIIAVPGDEWGSGADLTNLPIRFMASFVTFNADFRAAGIGSVFKMKGTVAQENVMGVYVLNEDGNHFEMNDAAVDAFRAYFAPTTNISSPKYRIALEDELPTAIRDIKTVNSEQLAVDSDEWFDLSGRKIVNGQWSIVNGQWSIVNGQLPRGIYIHNGQKVIVK